MSDIAEKLKEAAEHGGVHSLILSAARQRIIYLEALVSAYVNLDEAARSFGKEVFEEKAGLQEELKRKDAQINEALAVMGHGTEYDKIHVQAILSNGLTQE